MRKFLKAIAIVCLAIAILGGAVALALAGVSADARATDCTPYPDPGPPYPAAIHESCMTAQIQDSCKTVYETCEKPGCDPDPVFQGRLYLDPFFSRRNRYCMAYFRLSNGEGFYAVDNFTFQGYEVSGLHTTKAHVARLKETGAPHIVVVDLYVKPYDFTWLPLVAWGYPTP